MNISLSSTGKIRYVVHEAGEELLRTLSLPELAKFISEEYPEDLAYHAQGIKKIFINGANEDTQIKFDRLLISNFTKENSFYSENIQEEKW